MSRKTSILVLGAGELGFSVLRGLSNKRDPKSEITVLLRPATANLPRQAPKVAPIYALPGDVKILPCDLIESSLPDLAHAFKPFDVVIGCTGYDQNSAGTGDGLQSKIAKAVLEAGTVKLYVPWQFGVDYDLFDYGDAAGLFDEQKDIRKLLRQETEDDKTGMSWIIVSTGIFMSFLFQSFWGVVQKDTAKDGWIVNALGSWETATTVTTPEDIGRLTAEIVFEALSDSSEAKAMKNSAVFIAGDTVTYAQLVDIVHEATGKPTRKGEVLDMKQLEDNLAQDSSDILHKYRVAFGRGKGVSWNKEASFNHRHGIDVQSTESWAKDNLR